MISATAAYKPSRRQMLAGLAAIGPAATLRPHPDAELIAACDEFHRADAALGNACRKGNEQYYEAADKAFSAAVRRVSQLRFSTEEGMRKKSQVASVVYIGLADAFVNEAYYDDGVAMEEIVLSVLRQVAGLAE